MMNTIRQLLFVLALLSTAPAVAADNFISIILPHGVTVDLPRNWEALTNKQRITLDTSVQARHESTRGFDASSDLNFAANYYDDSDRVAAIMNIRYYPKLDISQADAQVMTAADNKELDKALQDSFFRGSNIGGYKIVRWLGTSKQNINGAVAFITEYSRSALEDNGNFRVRLVRVFNVSQSFTLTVSYRERDEYLLRPICDRIIASLQI